MPADLLGLILFLAAVSPGYVYLRVAEARRPRPTRETLILTVEIFLIGSIFTGLAGIVVSAAMQAEYGLVEGWLAGPETYFKQHYTQVVAWIGFTILLAHITAAATAWLVYRKIAPGYSLGGSVWTQILARDHDKTLVLVSVHLVDSRVVSGYVAGFDLDAERGQRELALYEPIFLQVPGKAPIKQTNLDRLIVSAQEIKEIGVRYEETAAVIAS